MADKEILHSNLLEPGAMFKVTDEAKDSNIYPGSLGFISFVRGIDESYQDVAKVAVIIIRRGKTGKPRVMTATICVPVFFVDHKGFRKLLPESGSKKYFMHIERYRPIATDLMAWTPVEFLGYATAISRRIKHMSDQCRHKKWPEAKSHPINVMKRMPDYFEEDPEHYMNNFASEEFRDNFLQEARKMSSSLVRMQIHLDMTRVDTEINAAEFLLFTNKGEFIPDDAEDKANEYKFMDDNTILKNTVSFHKKLKSDIEKLYKDKRNKKS